MAARKRENDYVRELEDSGIPGEGVSTFVTYVLDGLLCLRGFKQ